MKIYKYYLLSFLTLGILFQIKAAEDTKLPPVSLSAERTWIDQVHLSWGQPSSLKKANTEKLPWKVAGSFNPMVFSNMQQASPVSDGKFIYVASWSASETSVFYQYDMNGKYLDQFKVEGLTGSVRDMAFDGTYFYGGVQNINSVFVMDFTTKKVVKTIPVDLSKFAMRDRDLRHVSYIPTLNNGNGGLELGSSSHSFIIDLEGNIIEDSALLFKDPCYSTSYYNGFIYAFTETYPDAIAGNGKTIVEYNATTFAPTGRILDLRDFQRSDDLPLMEVSHFPSGMEFIESPNGRMLAICGLQSGVKNLIVKLEVERASLPNGMLGYNIYRNGTKINNSGLESNTLEFIDKNVAQGVDYTYAVKAVYQSGESEPATTTLSMIDTRQLPFFENFESYYYNTGFWNVKDTSAWIHTRMSIAGSAEKYVVLANFKGFFKDTLRVEDYLVSRPFTTLGKNKVLVRYQVAMDVRHPECADTLFLEVFDGQQWHITDKIAPNQIDKALQHRNFDVSDHLANKDNVRIRFRVSGPNNSNRSYDFYINEVKLWSPDYKQIAGNISKENPIRDAILNLKMNNDIIVYSTKTDAEGNYSLAEVEVGSYTLSVNHQKYNELVMQDFIIDKNLSNLDLELKQPKMTLGEAAINVKMSPMKSMRYTLPLNNSGDGDGTWIAGFEFPEKNTSKKETSEYKWDVFTAFNLEGNAEDKMIFHQGYIRTLFQSGANYFLMKYSKFGDFLGADTLFKGYLNISCMLSDGTDIYFLLPAQTSSLYRYNISTKQFTDTISFPKLVQYATYDPISKGFYIGDQYNLYLADSKGGIQKTFNIGNTASAKSVILDTVTSTGHFLWIYGTRGVPGQSIQGENIGIYQFSLDSNKYTGVAHTPNDFPGYTVPVYSKRQTCDATSMVGSYDYFTGKFVLIGSLKESFYGSLRPSKLFVYDMGQSVKWIGMETFRDTCKAGMPLNYVLNFNTENTKHGDRLEATVRFNFVPLIEDFIVPITLTIDTTIDAKCFVPSNLQTTVYSDEYVDLTFEIKDHDGSIVDESDLLGFNIRRNGIKLNDNLITGKTYRDLSPTMGMNRYSVQAVYSFNCESFWSMEDTAEVIYAGVCKSVKKIDLKVTNQRHLTLNWLAPENEVDGISETFESYKAFSIDSLGEWELRDLDRAATYGFEQAQFPHAGDPMSFIVFNPKQTRPAAPVETFQGEQVLACFSTRVNGLANNDWLISPLLNNLSSVAFNFMAKTHSPQYSLERIKVGYSMTGKAESDFIWFNEGKHYQVPGEWTEYSFVIPAGAKYVVINCVTVNSFMLLLDNLYIGAPKQHFSLKNYQVWRNDEHITDLTPKAIGMNDFALEDGTYKYEVVASYTNGCVSPKSTPVEVEIKMTNQTNPVRNLRGEYVSAEKAIKVEWSAPSWSDPQLLKYHTDSLVLGLGLVGDQPAPFYVAAAFAGKDLIFEMDYSFTGIEIGMLDSCKATAFVMCDGEFLTQQVVTNAKFPGFTTVTFDNPVKIDIEKTYLVGYKIEKYKKNTYPAGSDNGPLAVDKGNFISMDGWNWNTTTGIWGDEYKQNWNITAIIEIVANTGNSKNNINLRDENRKGLTFTADRKKANDVMTSYLRVQNHIQKAINPIVGYQLYKDGQALHSSPLIAYSYKDEQVKEGDNKYYVVTTYQNAGKISSDTLNVLYSPINIAEDIENGLQVSCKDKVITIQLTNNAKHSIAIHDVNGSLVERKENILSSQTEFFMNKRPKGTYLVVITQGSMQICRKIIVL